MVTVEVDGRAVQALPGQDLLRACLDAGIYIPHLCAHPDLPAQGGCRMCMVEVDGHDGPVHACEVTVADGMVVRTETPAAVKVRNVALELILAPHPKDCTSCRAYLNCELQAIMQYTGVAHSRLREIEKETAHLGESDPILSKEMFRCIQCLRCVRACDDLRGVNVLAMNHLDGEAYVGTPGDVPHAQTDCRFCSACIEVCPTGTLMDPPGMVRADRARARALVPCTDNCPARTDIPLYLRLAGQGRYGDSVAVFREKLTFPLALGYVCTHACESDCKRGRIDQPLSIREVKRFAVEQDTEQAWRDRVTVAPPTGRRVAVVGAGPAGLTGAYYLARAGHDVTVLERRPKAGGMLTYGIPRHRLPQEVVDGEVDILVRDAGFTVTTSVDVTDVTDLRSRYDAVLVAVGAQAGSRPPQFRGDWTNVHDGVVVCGRWNEGRDPGLGDVVSVLGGGNVALDCARSAKRAGATTVRVLCPEPFAAMTADTTEIRDAIAEGVEIVDSVVTDPVPDGDRVAALRVTSIRGFAAGAEGFVVDAVAGSERDLATDSVIVATGQRPDLAAGFGLPVGDAGFAAVGPGGATAADGVFAAGDVVTGTVSVIAAIAAARAAAVAVDRFLGGAGAIDDVFFDREGHDPVLGTIPDFSGLARTDCRSHAAVAAETSRCLHCELRGDIETVKYWNDPAYRAVTA